MSRVGQVLRGLLPPGGYETAPTSLVAKDIDAHATAFDGVLSADRALLGVAKAIPSWLVPEFEADYALPMKCLAGSSFVASLTINDRIANIEEKMTPQKWYTPSGIAALMAKVDVTLIEIQRYKPATCVGPCTQMGNTPRSRFRMNLVLHAATSEGQGIVPCLIANYLPIDLEIRTIFE